MKVPQLSLFRTFISLRARAIAVLTGYSLSFLLAVPAYATDLYWIGNTGANATTSDRWEAPGNWSLTQKGVTCSCSPRSYGTGAIAHLSFGGGTIRIRSRATASGVELATIWTGTLLLGSGNLKLAESSLAQGGGLRIGSGYLRGGYSGSGIEIAATGSGYSQTGGVVTLGGLLMMSGSFKVQSTSTPKVVFTSTGTLTFNGGAQQFFTTGLGRNRVVAKHTNITLRNSATTTSTNSITVSGAYLSTSGALTITTGTLDLTTNSVGLAVRNGIAIASAAVTGIITNSNVTSSGSLTVGALSKLAMNGSTTLTMVGTSNLNTNNSGSIYNLTVSGSTTLTGHVRVSNQLLVNSGATLTLNTKVLAATGSTIQNYGTITKGTGKIVHTSTAAFAGKSDYSSTDGIKSGDTIYFSVTDTDQNVAGQTADTITVTVTNAAGDSESATLTETSGQSGIFRGTIATQSATVSTGNSKMDASTDGAVTMTFTDSGDGLSIARSLIVGVVSTTTTSVSGGGGGSTRGSGGGGGGGTTAKTTTTKVTTPPVKKVVAPVKKVVTPVKKAPAPAKKAPAKTTKKKK